jgi:fructokinase
VLDRLFEALPLATRFYDVNLRPGHESPPLVDGLLRRAHVVKFNEQEVRFVHEHLGLPLDPERFCRAGAERYGWEAACVTFGPRGCAMLIGDDFVCEPGVRVEVADPVGAGDAFAAAFIDGIEAKRPAARVASAANRLGAFVASQPGSIPDWSPDGAHDR